MESLFDQSIQQKNAGKDPATSVIILAILVTPRKVSSINASESSHPRYCLSFMTVISLIVAIAISEFFVPLYADFADVFQGLLSQCQNCERYRHS